MALTIDFTGATVLVSGGAAGLGPAIARAFGAAGARVAVIDLDPARNRNGCGMLVT
jgi:NAD(P)-dependent dehydrogenase (short-subunit alcohol dehydrogenase family)